MEEESTERLPNSDFECGVQLQEKLAGKMDRAPGARNIEVEEEAEEEEDMLAWLTLDEETVMELSNLLEPSQDAWSSALERCNFKVKFIDNPYTSPPVIVQTSTAYVTINGNEESCGSSFSDSESSVMASVDRCCCVAEEKSSAVAEECSSSGEFGDGGGAWGSDAIGFWEGNGGGYAEGVFVKEIIDGCDWMETGFDVDLCDDDMWEKFLGNDLFGRSW